MKSEHINIKKMAIPFLSLAIASQAAGCGSTNQADMQNMELPEAALTQAEIADLDIDWGEGPYPIYKYDWDYESDWKEIFEKSNDDYQLELQYCEEKCPEKVITASYIDGYFEWKDKYVKNQVKSEDSKPISTEKPVIPQSQNNSKSQNNSVNTGNTNSKPQSSKPQTSKPVSQQNNKPSSNSGYVEPDIEPITSGNDIWIHQECNPDGTTIDESQLSGGTEGNDYSNITVH